MLHKKMTFEPTDRIYSDWQPKTVDLDYDPINDRLLVGDKITKYGIERISRYRTEKNIPGILIYEGRTFGRYGSRMLFRCVPNNRLLPEFIIPYADKYSSFSKNKVNKYVLFRFVEWIHKHPMGVLTNVLGDVTDYNIFDDYQLYCKDIFVSMQSFQKETIRAIRNHENIVSSLRGVRMITIDPIGSLDLDDALGVSINNDGLFVVNISIANVVYWLEKLQLWDHITDRVATIYLANRNISMLPSALGENICSLHKNSPKYVITMSVVIEDDTVKQIGFKNECIKISENYDYDDIDLLHDNTFISLKKIALSLNSNYQKYLDDVTNTHEVVAYYMMLMNHEVGKRLLKQRVGIYRSVVIGNAQEIPPIEGFNVYSHIKGEYTDFERQKGHQMLGLNGYIHCTSPIRRIVDIINLIQLQLIHGDLDISNNANMFVNKWMNSIDELNRRYKVVRKIQNNSILLNICMKNEFNEFTGYIIDNTYSVFIPSLKLTTNISSVENLELYKAYQFILFIFMDENTFKKKVRIQLKI